jgi:hypothetical protein
MDYCLLCYTVYNSQSLLTIFPNTYFLKLSLQIWHSWIANNKWYSGMESFT